MGTKDQIFNVIAEKCTTNTDKVTVVGTGDVGMATAFSILAQGVSSDVAIIDMNESKMMGELMDLQHGSLFLNAKISAGPDYACTAGSKICIITAVLVYTCAIISDLLDSQRKAWASLKREAGDATVFKLRGVRQKEGETRLALVQRNADVLKAIVPNLMKHSPDTILIIVTNPCDIMAWVAWKLSGLPKNKVFASGTNLDTARFRFFIGDKFGVSPESVHAWIIGEHGDTSVAVWSGVNISGVRLKDLNPNVGTENDSENWKDVHKEVVAAAYNVIKLKGFTSWGIGLSAASIVKSILRNSNKIHPVGTCIKGMCGIEHELFLSLPCVLGRNGVTSIIDIHLAEDERCSLKFSAAKMMEIINGIKL